MTDRAFVLIVEDEAAHGDALAEGLQRSNHVCRVVASSEEAIESLRQRSPDVVVTDYRLGGELDGLDVLRAAKRNDPDTEVILITAFGSEELASKALSPDDPDRAYDYLIKPIDIDQLRNKVDRAARQAITARQNRELRQQVDRAFSFEGIIGSSESLARVIKRVRRLARTKSTVLLVGESGTGKELFARAIHNNSPRKDKPFKVVNCAAFTETLLDSELFGHVKGAFTGALANRKGLLEAAHGGTLFLDEVGDMPLSMQAKLLRALENGEVMAVGSTEVTHVDIRFVGATHHDLWARVEEKEFREDLFYRLHANGAVRIPPLRERREDIPLLIGHFIDNSNSENGTVIEGTSPEAMRKLTHHSWRGNVRELRHVIERMCIEAESDLLEVRDLPDNLRGSTELVPSGFQMLAGLSMADMEKLHIMNTLRMYDGNREKTAKALKIGARTLYRKLNEYGLR